jgi:heptosyltransferase-2
MRTLLIAPSWVGDMVMAEPLVRLLREREPHNEIHIAAPDATRALASRMCGVSASHDWPFIHGVFDLQARVRVAHAWRQLHFTRAIVLPNSWKSALVPFLAGIPHRRGYVGEARYALLNERRALQREQLPLMVQRFLALGLDVDAPPPAPVAPRLHADRARAAQLRRALDLHDTVRPVLALCCGAEYGVAKRWPAEHFAEIAVAYRERGWQVWLFGSPNDADSARAIVAALAPAAQDRIANLVGRTSLADAVDLLGEAAAVASNDSGLMHVAAALERPVVGVFGSSSDAFTPPLGARARSVGIELPCRPCFARTCRFGHYDCLRKLPPARVVSALDEALEQVP